MTKQANTLTAGDAIPTHKEIPMTENQCILIRLQAECGKVVDQQKLYIAKHRRAVQLAARFAHRHPSTSEMWRSRAVQHRRATI